MMHLARNKIGSANDGDRSENCRAGEREVSTPSNAYGKPSSR